MALTGSMSADKRNGLLPILPILTVTISCHNTLLPRTLSSLIVLLFMPVESLKRREAQHQVRRFQHYELTQSAINQRMGIDLQTVLKQS